MERASLGWLILLFVVGPIFPVAAQDTPAAVGAAPWYSLFGDNRSDTFSNLRVQRLELSRQLNALETEVRDLRLNNEVLDESIRQQKGRRDARVAFPSDTSTIDELLDKRKRLEFTGKQRVEDVARDRVNNEARLKELEAAGASASPTELSDVKMRIAEAKVYADRFAEENRFELEQLDVQIKRAQAQQTQIETVRAADEKAREATLAADEKAFADNSAAVVAALSKIAGLYSDIDAIDAKILKLIDVGDTDGWFKIIISLSFAALVAGVIYGFYRVINGNRNIVHAIFSNDSGIQFVTIFSIIIAVILFGIIGVLEGKELSALLGGLSGYILGRNAASAKTTSEILPDSANKGSAAPPNAPISA